MSPETAPQGRRILALLPEESARTLQRVTSEVGFHAQVETGLSSFLRRLREEPWLATILSLSADLVDHGVVERVGQEPTTGALVLTATAMSLERAMLMERAGAVGLLAEPLAEEELRSQLDALSGQGRETPLPLHEERVGDEPILLGEGRAMGAVFQSIARVARSQTTVLITGESGTGKEVVARALHWASDRRSGPFVAVNCAAIPEHLLESELFGHERGAFTGAVAARVGRFQRAHGGTLFLDEIGDMSLVLQAKVLRALEERVVEPVGGTEVRPVDVRVIAATNHRLEERIAEGEFREDLYYRLAVVGIHLPPLRERRGDIRTLALHFAAEFSSAHRRALHSITDQALGRLERAHWAGNVRELRNVMDRAVLLAHPPVIRSGDLRLGAGAPSAASTAVIDGGGYPPTFSLQQVEADHIQRVLDQCDGHIGNAAGILGVHRNTLTRKVQEYGLRTIGEDGGRR